MRFGASLFIFVRIPRFRSGVSVVILRRPKGAEDLSSTRNHRLDSGSDFHAELRSIE